MARPPRPLYAGARIRELTPDPQEREPSDRGRPQSEVVMALAGERFGMPDGSVYVLRIAAGETDGAFVEMDFILPSGCVPPHRTSTCTRSRSTRSSRGPSRS